jgi:hypothetical protein
MMSRATQRVHIGKEQVGATGAAAATDDDHSPDPRFQFSPTQTLRIFRRREEMAKKTAVTRILLCLAVLFLSSVTALAAGARRGYITTHNGRMVIATKGDSHAIVPAVRSDAGLTTFFSNLSEDALSTYFCCYGNTISGSASFLGHAYAVAVPFTPANTGTVVRAKAGVGWGGAGPNTVTLAIWSDSNGLPGAELTGAHRAAKNLGNFGACCKLAVVTFKTPVPVTANTQYWLVMESSESQTDGTFDAASFNAEDQTYLGYAGEADGVWGAASFVRPSVAILGN